MTDFLKRLLHKFTHRHVSDNLRYEAELDDAVISQGKVSDQIVTIAKNTSKANTQFEAATEKIMFNVGIKRVDVIADLLKGMKGGH